MLKKMTTGDEGISGGRGRECFRYATLRCALRLQQFRWCRHAGWQDDVREDEVSTGGDFVIQ